MSALRLLELLGVEGILERPLEHFLRLGAGQGELVVEHEERHALDALLCRSYGQLVGNGQFLLVPHAGAPARPLGVGASGGELSRVMLAIEVSLATADDAARPATFVFDEVDAGVGSRAAVEVGRRLAELARGAQVLVVTHLAQVAAFADVHLVVTKSGGSVTVADVAPVTGDDRVSELARMLSGQEDSDTALQHAAELLQRSVVG